MKAARLSIGGFEYMLQLMTDFVRLRQIEFIDFWFVNKCNSMFQSIS